MPDRTAPPPAAVRWTALAAAGLLGLAVERAAGSWDDPRLWVPDLLVGVVLAGAALLAWPQHPGLAALLGLTSAWWFLGTAWAPAAFLHVGSLVHALLAHPSWRPRGRVATTAVVAAAAVTVAMPSWQSDAAIGALAVGLVAVLLHGWRTAVGPLRHHRLIAVRAGCGLALSLVTGALLRTVVPDGAGADAALLLHGLTVGVVALVLVSDSRSPAVGTVTDLVVELGETRSGTLRDALAATLGDPSLQLGHLTTSGAYVDAHGLPVSLPTDSRRTATVVERDGRPFVLLVHDEGVLGEAALVDAVASATRLATSHTALRGEVEARTADLQASRRRLLLAADDAQAELESRVRDGAERRLEALDTALRSAAARVAAPPVHVERARQELAHALDDLRTLARGLRPRELDHGLRGALEALAARSPVPVVLEVDDGHHDREVDQAVWFVCTESVANAVKHAGADRIWIAVHHQPDRLVVLVRDDGRGGADLAVGSGLRGLADRVDALGGRLLVHSPSGAGTRVTAELPLDRHPL